MTWSSIVRALKEQYFNARYLTFVASVVSLALLMLIALDADDAFRSSEVRFSDASSRSGLPIVPASCPSNPHTAGECDCTPSYYCSGNDRRYIDATCVDTFVETCPYGCSGGVCLPQDPIEFISFEGTFPSGGGFDASGHLQAAPALVRYEETTQLYWNVDNATSCTVSGDNGDSWAGVSSGTSGATTSSILKQTTYTLYCEALPDATPATITETAVVNIIPIFEEV